MTRIIGETSKFLAGPYAVGLLIIVLGILATAQIASIAAVTMLALLALGVLAVYISR